ncbi:MAG: sulfite oxidase-like oxidoreductase [Gloeocapsa sp. DLM2.Bin57]|nr:MAG: sulfite oxidase-like oxidoreductase [Gloeocapsa sp. DLM2.Bin57]
MEGKFFSKPDPSLSDRVPPGQRVAKGFPVLTYGETPLISIEDWQLRVSGLATPKSFSWSDLISLPQSQFTADFHCVTRWSKLDVQWTGVKVTDFLTQVELTTQPQHVLLHCYGGYTTNLTWSDFAREDNFLAHQLFAEPLPQERGGPVRLVVPHLYAWKSAKWLNGIEFLTEEKLGFWEVNGYHSRGEPWQEQRYS